jgi:hypothetical protein
MEGLQRQTAANPANVVSHSLLSEVAYSGRSDGSFTGRLAGAARNDLRGDSQKALSARGPSKADFEARRRKREHEAKHEALIERRRLDEKAMAERHARNVQQREERLEKMLESIYGDSSVHMEVSQTLREHEDFRTRKCLELHDAWDMEVMRRVEYHVAKKMSREPAPCQGMERTRLMPSDDPLNLSLREERAEKEFQRVANSVLGPPPAWQLPDEQEEANLRLPVEMWEQDKHYSTPYGYFAQNCERGTYYHGLRRMGTNAHRIDESDGVVAAGKTRFRTERNLLGMLAGTVAKQGESAKYKKEHGGGCAAPCQDHYNYERNLAAVEAEFPLGKRVFPHLQAH